MKVFYLRADLCLKNKKQFLQKRIVYLLVFTVLSGISASVLAQPSSAIRLSGTVLSAETGQPLQGASIKVTGRGGVLPTTPDTQTDAEGTFALYTSLTEGIIQVSYIGCVTQTIPFSPAATSPFTINLEKDENALQEVEINAGYYTVNDRERTGSIARVDAKTIEKQPVLNVLEALKGQMAGVDIQQVNGEPGGGFTVRVRGQNSLRTTAGVNDPLYLVDGVPFNTAVLKQYGNTFTGGNPLNTINPGDIASIEVLKDADATAIYGSRGSNGVVLITTKRGQAGASRLSADASYGTGGIRRFTRLLNTEQYLEMRKEAYMNNSLATPSIWTAKDMLVYDSAKYTDWQRELLGKSTDQLQSRLAVSGGAGAIRYLMSGQYTRQGNIYPGDVGYARGSGHASFSQGTAADRLQVQLAVTYTHDKNLLPDAAANLVYSALTMAPNAPDMLDDAGRINWENGEYHDNPAIPLFQPYTHQNRMANVQSVIGYKLLDNVGVKMVVGYARQHSEEDRQVPASSMNPQQNPNSRRSLIHNFSTVWNVEPQIDWKFRTTWGEWQGLAGGTLQATESDGHNISASGFTHEALMYNFSLAPVIYVTPGRYNQYRYLAAFTRINFSHRQKVMVNLTARRDGSSRFGPGKQWGNFGAVGAAWLFSEESAVQRWLPWLSLGKIRGSYGITGSDQIADYGYLSAYQVNPGFLYQVITSSPVGLANADYRWESNRKLEAAMELAGWNGAVSATMAWYRNRSGNQLVGYPLPSMSGFNTVQYNLPATVENSGWEFSVLVNPVNSSDFRWSISLNASFPRRVLRSFPDIEASSYHQVFEVGKSMDRNRRYAFEGVDPATGLYRFADPDGNGAVSDDDRVWRNMSRTVFGGMNHEWRYRQVSLSVFLQFDKRERILQQSYSAPGSYMGNQPVGVMQRWRQPDDATTVQKFYAEYAEPYVLYSYMSDLSTAWLKDTFFIRLNNVVVKWDAPQKYTRMLGLQGLALSVQAQNLWVSDRANRFDPETNFNQVPPLRMVTGSLQIVF